MIAEETINKLLRDIISVIINQPEFTVIRGKQNGAPRPTGSYADVNFLFDDGIGWEERKVENEGDDDVKLTAEGYRLITMSLGFYRDGSTDFARKVRTALVRESIVFLMNQAKVGLIDRTEVRDISEPLENGFEQRAQFDVVLSAVGTDEEIVKAINSLDIVAELHQRNVKTTQTIEVRP